MNDAEIIAMVHSELKRAQSHARQIFGTKDVPEPIVLWNLRGRTLGQAIGYETIRVNMDVARALGKSYIKTVTHEYAHILNAWFTKYTKHPVLLGDKSGGHGRAWRNIMVQLGQEPTRCTRDTETINLLKVSGAMGETFTYKCSCREYHVSKRMHNKIQNGSGHFCKSCRATLTLP